MVTDHLLGTYKELKEMVSPNIGYHRYRQDIRVVHQSPCIPHLGEQRNKYHLVWNLEVVCVSMHMEGTN